MIRAGNHDDPLSTNPVLPMANPPRGSRFRVWHLTLAPLLVAIAAANLRDQRIQDPALLALAVGGFALYFGLGWIIWRLLERLPGHSATVHRCAERLGLTLPTLLLVIYLTLMGALFLGSSVVYLLIEAHWPR